MSVQQEQQDSNCLKEIFKENGYRNEDFDCLLAFKNPNDAKLVLTIFMNYVRGHYKAEKIKQEKYKKNPEARKTNSKKSVFKYIDKEGNPKLPFTIDLICVNKSYNIISLEKYAEKYVENITFESDVKPDTKKQYYVPVEDRIPGKYYGGVQYMPKNKYIQSLLDKELTS